MSKRKYRVGLPVHNTAEFDAYNGNWFIVKYGNTFKTTHRSFLISWQYRTLKRFIDRGWIYIADRIEENDDNLRDTEV